MLNRLSSAALAAAFIGVAGSAMAQGVANHPSDFSIRAGVFFPTDDNTRKNATSMFAFGVEYKFTEHFLMDKTNDSISLSLDFAANNMYRTVPLLVNMTRHNGPMYVTGGVGVAFTKRPVTGGVEDKAQFAYQLGAGYEFNTADFPVFVEAKWMGNGRAELNGFLVALGARF